MSVRRYYGIIGNFFSLQAFREGVRGIWRRRLSRRRRDGDVTSAEFLRLEQRYSLPAPAWSTVCGAA